METTSSLEAQEVIHWEDMLTKAFIIRMSEGGGVQWIKRYGIIDTPNNTFWGVVEADDGGFVLAGEKLQDRNFEFYDHFW